MMMMMSGFERTLRQHVVSLQVFHAPSFGDEDFELNTTTSTTATPPPVRPSAAPSDPGGGHGQQSATTADQLHGGDGRPADDEEKCSPTSPDTGCWSSPDVSGSPSSEVKSPVTVLITRRYRDSPYSITERRVPELIAVLFSQLAGS